jgi:N-ethylmaleimide reductase
MHGIKGMLVDEDSIPVHEYIVKRLNVYDLAYLHLTEPFTPVDEVPFAVAQVAKHFRPLYKGTLIINKGFTGESGNKIISDGDADLVAFGVPFSTVLFHRKHDPFSIGGTMPGGVNVSEVFLLGVQG